MCLQQDLLDGEALEVWFNGQTFSCVFRRKPERRTKPGQTCEKLNSTEQTPEQWWTGLSAAKRASFQEVVSLLGPMQRDPDKFLEFRNTGHGIDGALKLKLNRPTGGGKAATN